MKLYTEEQVKLMLIKAKIFDGDVRENFTYILSESDILSSEKPIELPSDEEIDKGASGVFLFGADQGKFIAGANWVIEQIKQQSNGK